MRVYSPTLVGIKSKKTSKKDQRSIISKQDKNLVSFKGYFDKNNKWNLSNDERFKIKNEIEPIIITSEPPSAIYVDSHPLMSYDAIKSLTTETKHNLNDEHIDVGMKFMNNNNAEEEISDYFYKKNYCNDKFKGFFGRVSKKQVQEKTDIDMTLMRKLLKKLTFIKASDTVEYRKKLDIEEAKEKKKLERQTKILKGKEQIADEYLNVLQVEKQGHPVVMPTGIMIQDSDSSITKEIINWTKESSGGHVEYIKHDGDSDLTMYKLSTKGEEAAEKFDKDNIRTLIHIDNFQEFGTPADDNKHIIADLKEFLNCCADEFKATVIFDASHPSKIHSNLLEPHRVPVKINLAELIKKLK